MSAAEGTRHAGDALSALLDGELGDADADAVRAHVATCAPCSDELDDVRAARDRTRGLPPLDPPVDLLARLERRGRRRRLGAAAMVGAAAVSIAFAGMLPAREKPVKPAVAALVRTHAITASVDGDSLTGLATAGVPVSFRR